MARLRVINRKRYKVRRGPHGSLYVTISRMSNLKAGNLVIQYEGPGGSLVLKKARKLTTQEEAE